MFLIHFLISSLLAHSAFSLNADIQETNADPIWLFNTQTYSALRMPELRLAGGIVEIHLSLRALNYTDYISEISFYRNVYDCRWMRPCELKDKIHLSSIEIPLVRNDHNTFATDKSYEDESGIMLTIHFEVERRDRLVNEIELRKFFNRKNDFRRVFLARASLENTL